MMAITVVGSLTGAFEASSAGSTSVSVPLPTGATEGDRFVVLGAAIRTTELPSGWTRADSQYLGTGNWLAVVDYFDVTAATPPTNYVTTLDSAESGTPRWAYGAFLLRGVDLTATVLSATATGGSAPSVTAASADSAELRAWCRVGTNIIPTDSFTYTKNVYDSADLAGRMFTYIAGNVDVAAGAVGSATSDSTSSSAAGMTVVMEPAAVSSSTVTVTAANAPAVALSWNDNSDGPFDVLRDAVAIETGIAGTSYTDTDVTAGTSYSYTIRDASAVVSSAAVITPTDAGGVYWLRWDGTSAWAS